MNHGFQNLMFFSIFVYQPKDESTRKSIFKFQNAAIFLIFETSLFQWYSNIYTNYDTFWFFQMTNARSINPIDCKPILCQEVIYVKDE